MLLSLADQPDLVIKLPHMEEAIESCEKLIGNIRKTTHGKKGMSSLAAHKALIINELLSRDTHKITRTMIAKKYWMHFNITELDAIMDSLELAGMVKSSSEGGHMVYTMPEKEVKRLTKFLEGKN